MNKTIWNTPKYYIGKHPTIWNTVIKPAAMNNVIYKGKEYRFSPYSNNNGLKGLYSYSEGSNPSDYYHAIAVNLEGEVIAEESWSVMGNAYRYGQRAFGDQLERAGYDRQGF